MYIVCHFCMSLTPNIALLPFHFALIFTSFYLWSTFLLAFLIDSFRFCTSFFWFSFFYQLNSSLLLTFLSLFHLCFSCIISLPLFQLQVHGLIYAFTFLVFILSTLLYLIVLSHVVPHTLGLSHCATSYFGY